MQWLLVVLVLLIICFIIIVSKLVSNKVEFTKDQGATVKENEKLALKKNNVANVQEAQEATVKENEKLPYKVSDSLLTDAENSFYHALKLYVDDRAVICPKVGLKDIFFIGKGIGNDYMKYFGKISQKHVDFILCDPSTMKPLCGIELDDKSHSKGKRQERDSFVGKVFKDANLKLIRIPAKFGYTSTEIETAIEGVLNRPEELPKIQSNNDTVLCPKCGIPMVLRKATRGENAGNEFYGCPNYPKCKEIINKEAPSQRERSVRPTQGTTRHEGMKIGEVVRSDLRKMLEEGKASKEEIELMQTKEYSRETFHIQYPLLQKASLTQGESPTRYYVSPLKIYGEEYFLCSEWFEGSYNNDRTYLMKWFALHNHIQ